MSDSTKQTNLSSEPPAMTLTFESSLKSFPIKSDISRIDAASPEMTAAIFANCNVRIWTKDGAVAAGDALGVLPINNHPNVDLGKDLSSD